MNTVPCKVKGAATEASAVEREIPALAVLRAPQSVTSIPHHGDLMSKSLSTHLF